MIVRCWSRIAAGYARRRSYGCATRRILPATSVTRSVVSLRTRRAKRPLANVRRALPTVTVARSDSVPRRTPRR